MLGLGLLGRGLNDAKFLAECEADLMITDLKKAEDLKPTLQKLSKYKNIKYILGEHRLEDFKKRDFILKAAGVPLDSLYINEARKNKIFVEMDESLFTKLCPEVRVIGVTGTRGKTTTTFLIYEILKKLENKLGCKVYLGGNIKGLATLPLIKKVKQNDIVVMELSSWQLQGFGDSKISPHISVFTNFLSDHLNYYIKVSKNENEAVQKYFDDKAEIFANQKADDFLVLNNSIKKKIKKRYKGEIKSKIILTDESQIKNWKFKIKGAHNIQNILQAIEVAKILGIDLKTIKKIVENFNGVEGRQEFIKDYKDIKIYNDTTATTPDATLVALRSLGDKNKKKIVLIMGGADKNLDMSSLVKEVPKWCKKVILLAGTGTENLGGKVDGVLVKSLKDGLLEALKYTKKGDILLLSPAFASFGMFKNEFDRGDQFNKLVKKLK